jgi:hypothetical protein
LMVGVQFMELTPGMCGAPNFCGRPIADEQRLMELTL